MKMKKLFIASALILGAAASAVAESTTTISVQCTCSFTSEYNQKVIQIGGSSTDSSDSEISACIIQDGRVISGCLAAKINAQSRCWDQANEASGASFEANKARALILENTCFGEIDTRP
ncbi:MAG: hypothetical protein IPJ71_04865 [Bdellovibrionales bacterium]|nr:hypothetical protein [Bdellovibrionales bacterium]